MTQYSNNKINSHSMAHKNNRPQSSNSHNHLLYTNEQINFTKNRNVEND
jgi:urease beta subunit